ncbi:pirin family protein [Bdellovibrio sp. HCB337]|uniref:pirin family protein n=1 Tax=Bdellovibrio sp. HCB337 TaxID=3394358 RepID=UPI0039A779E6
MKNLVTTHTNNQRHWVGDGFPVRTIFGYNDLGRRLSPFLLMDYAGPADFTPANHLRGVGEHPHRGFETVTIVYSGEVTHRDSSGGGGMITPGDVQWMTAGSGLVHEEMHGKDFAAKGGNFEMIQLWVNLPAKDKMTKPRYQGIKNAQIPRVEFANGAGYARIIAGDYEGSQGPAKTFTPMNLWDVRLAQGAEQEFRMPKGHTTAVFVLSGKVSLGTGEELTEATIAILEKDPENFTLKASEDAKILILGGAPIEEPIVGYGPFVMNSMQEIQQAFYDFQAGKMGSLDRVEGTES